MARRFYSVNLSPVYRLNGTPTILIYVFLTACSPPSIDNAFKQFESWKGVACRCGAEQMKIFNRATIENTSETSALRKPLPSHSQKKLDTRLIKPLACLSLHVKLYLSTKDTRQRLLFHATRRIPCCLSFMKDKAPKIVMTVDTRTVGRKARALRRELNSRKRRP